MSLVMRTELPGKNFGHPRDLFLFYLAMSFGWNGAPGDFAIFGDVISPLRARFGMDNPSWHTPLPFLSRLYVADWMLFDIRNAIRQTANADTWEWVARGVTRRQGNQRGEIGNRMQLEY